ncbi:MAG TPA: ABC transporter permease [Candidatus Binatia bacterium]|nr:ABC transporter permease [Candidatus Binatia bacterium]
METATAVKTEHCELRCTWPTADTVCVELGGSWTIHAELPPVAQVQQQFDARPAVRRLLFDTRRLTNWDSGLLTFLLGLSALCAPRHIEIDPGGLPQGVQRLLRLATAVPERQGARREDVRESLLARIGKATLAARQEAVELLSFLGQATLAFGALLRGRARYQRADLLLIMQECGAQALPIVSLISLLVGLILAFIGAVQLQQFGAQIYIADLVGIGMARQMGAMMTGIIMAGRTGAAFAAQLGTMTVNEEIDALTTTGLPPMEFLVLPRMLALMVMMPLLALYADLMGILGGAVVGVGLMDLGVMTYYQETRRTLHLTDFAVGLVYAAVFGVLVAVAGCLRGMQCGRSASAVGEAATSAVVTAIVFIIVSDAILTVMLNTLGI